MKIQKISAPLRYRAITQHIGTQCCRHSPTSSKHTCLKCVLVSKVTLFLTKKRPCFCFVETAIFSVVRMSNFSLNHLITITFDQPAS